MQALLRSPIHCRHRSSLARRLALITASAIVLCGCAINGDFGRLRREYGLAHRPPPEGAPLDRAAYWRKLVHTDRRSEASAYAQIITDAQNDVVRIDPFFALAARVIDMDAKRARALAHVSAAS